MDIWICDGDSDCIDNSDEDNQQCGRTTVITSSVINSCYDNVINFITTPVLRTRSYVLRMFLLFHLSTHFLRRPSTQPTFSKLFHMTWLQPHRKCCYADFLKVPPNKNEKRKLQISPNFASNRSILSAVTRDVEGK